MAIISVFGSNGDLDSEVLQIAEQVGKLIVDMGHRVCCGGRGGVMEAVGKGARQSENWTGDQVIGLMPEADDSKANPYLDVIMPTGLGLFRNTLVAQCAGSLHFYCWWRRDSIRNRICLANW